MENLFDLMHSETILLVFSIWLVFMGGVFFLSFLFADKISFLKALADFFIAFSFKKRTKHILLSYAVLATLIGLLGIFFSSIQ